jgi:predicted dehydrogenase
MAFKVAFIGAGYMAEEHLKVFSAQPEFEITGIYSRSFLKAEQIAEKYDVKFVADSIDNLFKNGKPELLVICVPELELWNVFLGASSYPWKMLIEKPVGINVGESQKFLSKSLENGLEVYVALNRRHYESTRLALNKLKSDSGNRFVHITDQQDLLAAKLSGQPEQVLNNWMYANSIHVIDLFSIFCRGSAESVQTVDTKLNSSSKVISSTIQFDSGDFGIYNGIWNAPGPWQATITTEKTRYELRPLEKITVQEFPSRVTKLIDNSDIDQKFKPGLFEQSSQAIFMLKNQAHTLPSLIDSMKTMSLIERMYRGFTKNY